MLCLDLRKGQGEPKIPKAVQTAAGQGWGRDQLPQDGLAQPELVSTGAGSARECLSCSRTPCLSGLPLPFPGTDQALARP